MWRICVEHLKIFNIIENWKLEDVRKETLTQLAHEFYKVTHKSYECQNSLTMVLIL